MNKNSFSKFFLYFCFFFSFFLIIITENYKYINSKPVIFLLFFNFIIIASFFFKKIRFIIYINLFIFLVLTYLVNFFLFMKNPALVLGSDKLDYINKINKEKKIIYPDVPPITFLSQQDDFLPLSGLSDVLTVTSNEDGYWGKYMSDEYGFNNEKNQFDKLKRSNNTKLIFLGDSMTQGSAVNQEDNFVSLLNKDINIDALNLGYGGNGLLLSLATYIEFGKDIENSLVFFCFYEGNDFFEYEVEEKKNILLNRYLNSGFKQNLKEKNQLKDNIVTKKIKKDEILIKKNSYFNNFLFYTTELIKLNSIRKLTGLLNNKKEYYAFSEENYEKFNEIIKILKKNVEESNSKLIFIYVPAREHFYQGSPYNKPYLKIKNIVSNNKIPMIDLYKEITTKVNHFDLFPSGIMRHFNKSGHLFVSQIIKENIK